MNRPNQALQRTLGFGVQLPGAAFVRPAQIRAVRPAIKPATARAPGPKSLSLQSSGIKRWQRLIFRVAIFIVPFLVNAGMPFGPTDPISLKGEVVVWTWR